MKKILLVGANGYIGSRFLDLSNKDPKFNIVSIDNYLRDRGGHVHGQIESRDYRDLSSAELESFTDCVWLAGHSSVPQSIADPLGCVNNNLIGMIEFSSKFKGRLIYASSGSVYSSESLHLMSEESILTSPKNIYDFTKSSFDDFLKFTASNFVCLRFGTVNGYSRRLRSELLLNKMVGDAVRTGEINLANPLAMRPVLFIDDLIRALFAVLESNVSRQVYNLCSVNSNMECYAKVVSSITGANINLLPDSVTYNFGMTNNKFADHFNFQFTGSVDAIVHNLKSNLEGF